MPFSSIVRTLGRSPLTAEILSKLSRQHCHLNGIPRLPKGLLASTLAQTQGHNLLVVCATLEEAGALGNTVGDYGLADSPLLPHLRGIALRTI